MTASIVVQAQTPLLGKLTIKGCLHVETGLHVGVGGGNLDIGGLDHAVIRDPLTQHPYIPGSSIKGKLRSILERFLQKPINRSGGKDVFRYESDDLECGYTRIDKNKKIFVEYMGANICPLSRIFGSTGGTECWIKKTTADEQKIPYQVEEEIINGEPHVHIRGRNRPARLIVRDSHLTKVSATELKKIDTGLFMTEWKFENGIDRVTSAANPRQLERVAAGSEFEFEMVYTVEDPAQAQEDLKNLAIAIAILEDDALGGHGSRGYGKVKFQQFEFFYRGLAQYQQMGSDGIDFSTSLASKNNTQELLNDFGAVRNAIDQAMGQQLPSTPQGNS